MLLLQQMTCMAGQLQRFINIQPDNFTDLGTRAWLAIEVRQQINKIRLLERMALMNAKQLLLQALCHHVDAHVMLMMFQSLLTSTCPLLQMFHRASL